VKTKLGRLAEWISQLILVTVNKQRTDIYLWEDLVDYIKEQVD